MPSARAPEPPALHRSGPETSSVRVEVTVRSGVPDLLPVDVCRRFLEAAIDAAGAPPISTVSLTLSDDAELASLNEVHMGQSGPTDVLSFPLLPPSAFPVHPGQAPSRYGSDVPLPAVPVAAR